MSQLTISLDSAAKKKLSLLAKKEKGQSLSS